MIPASIKHLAYLLKCRATDVELLRIAEQLSVKPFSFDKTYYRERKEVSVLSNGKFKTRILNPSKSRLKLIQSRIKKNLLDTIEFPPFIQGGLKRCSNITNASLHLGNKYKFTSDIKRFFPSVKPDQVYQALSSLNYKPEVARIVTILTTYKGMLPQGTPTSSHLANLVLLKTDQDIHSFCKAHGITYSRYIDDITLSSKQDFQAVLPVIIEFINNAGYKISSRKTQYRHILEITGIETKNNVLAPNKKFYQRLETEQDFDSKFARLRYMLRVKKTKKFSNKSKN